mmetsp:Transcript_43638/g.124819  ORF Transcript_43638/g.124819 Transcript_43638/m.124819 type:complete len:241 (-) Transcript_43638:758-1480(-)
MGGEAWQKRGRLGRARRGGGLEADCAAVEHPGGVHALRATAGGREVAAEAAAAAAEEAAADLQVDQRLRQRRRRRWRRLLWRHLRRQRGRLRRRLWKQQRLRWCRRWSSTKRPCSIGRRFRHPAWLELQHQRLGYEPLRRWRGWRRIWYIILLWCSRAHNGCLRRFFLQGILCLGLGVGAFASGAERSRRRRIFFGLGRSRVRQVGCESRRRALMLRVEPDAGFFWCRPWASIRRRPRRL